MAEVYFNTKAKTSISDSAIRWAEKHSKTTLHSKGEIHEEVKEIETNKT